MIGVNYVSHMGTDLTPVNAARISFNVQKGELDEKDEKLLKYLAKNKHFTPFEHQQLAVVVHCPLYIRSQIHRHRTFCISGESNISFELPGDNRHYPIKLSRLFKTWSKSDWNKFRIQQMRIRNMTDGMPCLSSINDVYDNGKKEVIKITAQNKHLICTPDHKLYTENGWLEAADCFGRKVAVYNGHKGRHSKSEIVVETDREWRSIPDWEGVYEVSDAGNVRSLRNTRGALLDTPKLKDRTVAPNGYLSVSLSRNGVSRLFMTHNLVASAFLGPKPNGYQVRHLNGNRLDARLLNLVYGTPQDDRNDAIRLAATNKPGFEFTDVLDIKSAGKQVVYDVSVNTNHNFIANNFLVHNSYNEVSRRYTVDDIQFYVPPLDDVRIQSKSNKQGSEGVVDIELAEQFRADLEMWLKDGEDLFKKYIDAGVANEQARSFLGTPLMTHFYMTGNLRNWVQFLILRLDSHAQKEVRVIAERIRVIISDLWPKSYAALNEALDGA